MYCHLLHIVDMVRVGMADVSDNISAANIGAQWMVTG